MTTGFSHSRRHREVEKRETH